MKQPSRLNLALGTGVGSYDQPQPSLIRHNVKSKPRENPAEHENEVTKPAYRAKIL